MTAPGRAQELAGAGPRAARLLSPFADDEVPVALARLSCGQAINDGGLKPPDKDFLLPIAPPRCALRLGSVRGGVAGRPGPRAPRGWPGLPRGASCPLSTRSSAARGERPSRWVSAPWEDGMTRQVRQKGSPPSGRPHFLGRSLV